MLLASLAQYTPQSNPTWDLAKKAATALQQVLFLLFGSDINTPLRR